MIQAVFSAWSVQSDYKEVFDSIEEYRTVVESRIQSFCILLSYSVLFWSVLTLRKVPVEDHLLDGFSFCVSDVTARVCIRCLGDVFSISSVVVVIKTFATKQPKFFC
jgi:hypothetical protein